MIYRFAGIVPPFDLGAFPAPAKLPDQLSYRRKPDGLKTKKPKSRYAVLIDGGQRKLEDQLPTKAHKIVE